MFKKNLLHYVSYTVLMAATAAGTMAMPPAEKISSPITREQSDKIKHILTHVEGTEEDKADLKKMLDTLNRTQIGRDILSQVPKDIHYGVEEMDPWNQSCLGYYSRDTKKIVLNRLELHEKKHFPIVLAHEMRHAVQDQEKLLEYDFINQKDEAAVAKLCELETRVYDVLLESQLLALLENQNKTVSAPTMYYTALYAQGKKSGLSDKDAAQKAKDALIQSSWLGEGGQDEPNNPSPITSKMKDSSEFWSTGYNKQAMCRLVMQDRSLPRQNGVESAIDAYRKRLGSDLDASFFQNIPNMQFATNKDGSTVSQLISSDGILLQQNKQFYETEGVHAGDRHNEFTTYYESGSPEREIPYVNGQIHGMVKTYDQNGHLGQEIPYVNGQIHGMVKTYHENGRLKEETPYVNGQKHGTRKTYHENGQLMEEIPYIHGARQTQSPSETAPGSLKKTLSSAESVNDQLSVEKESGADGKINHAPKETLQPPQSPSETEPGSLKKTLSSAAQTKKPSTFELKKLVAQNLRR